MTGLRGRWPIWGTRFPINQLAMSCGATVCCQHRRRSTTWAAFIRTHVALLAGTDFFTAEVLTLRGLVTYATSYAPARYILAQCLVQSWILLSKRETPKTGPPLWSPAPPAEGPWQCWNISGKNASKS